MNINITITALEAKLWQDVAKKYRRTIKARKESLPNDMIIHCVNRLIDKLNGDDADATATNR